MDYEAPAFSLFGGKGRIFNPFPTLKEAFVKISKVDGPTLLSVVTGSYPEFNQKAGASDDIEVNLRQDSTLVLPVGSVAIWGKAGAPPE